VELGEPVWAVLECSEDSLPVLDGEGDRGAAGVEAALKRSGHRFVNEIREFADDAGASGGLVA
jgi:hypothetical protein